MSTVHKGVITIKERETEMGVKETVVNHQNEAYSSGVLKSKPDLALSLST